MYYQTKKLNFVDNVSKQKQLKHIKKIAAIDDCAFSELVVGARFDGIHQIPIIEKPKELIIPDKIVPFSKLKQANCKERTAIGFYEFDESFVEVLISPENFILKFLKFQALISPDCSLYRDAPLSVQITNVYRNRAIGYYYQTRGINVIPQVRWGGEETYTTKVLPEKIAFLGVEKNSIVAIGTYGCIRGKDNQYHLEAGLASMLETLEPLVVLVYGSIPTSIFKNYLQYTNFVQYQDWIKSCRGGNK
jgi:hypothetical protein